MEFHHGSHRSPVFGQKHIFGRYTNRITPYRAGRQLRGSGYLDTLSLSPFDRCFGYAYLLAHFGKYGPMGLDQGLYQRRRYDLRSDAGESGHRGQRHWPARSQSPWLQRARVPANGYHRLPVTRRTAWRIEYQRPKLRLCGFDDLELRFPRPQVRGRVRTFGPSAEQFRPAHSASSLSTAHSRETRTLTSCLDCHIAVRA